MPGQLFCFGPFALDAQRGELHREGVAVPLGQRAMALLVALVHADGRVVGKEELLRAAWPSLVVEDSNLSVQIAHLRKALGPTPAGHVESPYMIIPSRSAEQRLGWQCLTIEVDMDGALNILKEKGVEAAWGPVKRPDYARAEIRDPDATRSSCGSGIVASDRPAGGSVQRVYLPQEALNDFSRLGIAADKRYSLEVTDRPSHPRMP